MVAVQQQNSITWGKFFQGINSLHWYDLFTSFIFRFMAKTSEPLLAAGVIISAIDFLQRGELLANNATLSLWWSVAQGVAMEVSVGPVLVLSLDAHEQGDKTKAIMYASLSGTLAIVGGAMLFLQFALTVGGLHDNQISPYVVWPLFLLRTVASIGYIALSCTKHKRFSGVSAKQIVSETNKAFEDAMARFTAMNTASLQAMEQVQARLTQIEANTAHQIEGVYHSLLHEFDSRLIQMDGVAQERFQEVQRSFMSEVSLVKITLEKQSQVIKQLPERTSVTEVRQFQPTKLVASEFDKKKFVTECLTEHPEMSGADIQRKATERGYTISAGYISDIRKSLGGNYHA